MTRKFCDIPLDEESEKAFYLDYISFGVPSRYICALALSKAFDTEQNDLLKRTYAVGIAHQRFMAMEDARHICSALRIITKNNATSRFHEEIAKKHKNTEEKETIASIRDGTFLTEIGLKKDLTKQIYYRNKGITKTVLSKQWRSYKDGLKKLLFLYDDYYEDLNKIKHGYSVISSPTTIFKGMDDFESFVCSVIDPGSGKACETRMLTSNKTEVVKSHIDDLKILTGNIFTLMLMFAVQKYRQDKTFMKSLDEKGEYVLELLK